MKLLTIKIKKMKASNDLIKKFGVDKIIHGLIGMLILAVCVVTSVFLFGASFLSVLGGMVLGSVSAWLAGKWKESKDDVPDTTDIRATVIVSGVRYISAFAVIPLVRYSMTASLDK